MSKLRCWPGCLAYVVKDDFPENIGGIVEVIRRAGFGFDYDTAANTPPSDWEVRPFGHHIAWNWDGSVGPADDTVGMPDSYLRPITPPPSTKDTPTDVPEAAEV